MSALSPRARRASSRVGAPRARPQATIGERARRATGRLRSAFYRLADSALRLWRRLRLSTFEKVIVANSAIIVLATLAGWEVTQRNPEPYHYLIDTLFITLTALLGVGVNFALLRAAFKPLLHVLTTIQAVERGDLEARASASASDPDASALAASFNAMLDQLAEARDESAAQALRAQEEERRRVALELHDQTGQTLTALALHAQVIAQSFAGATDPLGAQTRARAERLAALAQSALVEAQELSRRLRPSVLDDLGLAAALRWLADDASERLGLRVMAQARGDGWERDVDGLSDAADPARLPDEIETALFRIAQESVTNAARHGRATQARLALRRGRDRVTLVVADDGCGFDPMEVAARREDAGQRRGLGLDGMRERARLLGGALTLRTRPGGGCVARVVVPLPPACQPCMKEQTA